MASRSSKLRRQNCCPPNGERGCSRATRTLNPSPRSPSFDFQPRRASYSLRIMDQDDSPNPWARALDGFGLSVGDACLLAGTAALAWGTWGLDRDLTLIALLAVGHFFLYCNVFRVRRAFELCWAGLFIVNIGAWLLAGGVQWGWALAIQLPATALAIGAEMASANYHGIGWRVMRSEAAVEGQREGGAKSRE